LVIGFIDDGSGFVGICLSDSCRGKIYDRANGTGIYRLSKADKEIDSNDILKISPAEQ
jgi:hypothetical protein